MKKRFTEEQIIGILKEAEAGMKVAELCRKHGIAEATYYNWKAEIRRHDRVRCSAAESLGSRECQAETTVGRVDVG